jgi:hypothetical protein
MMAKLRILLKLCFLRELGFSADKIRSFFSKNGAYQQLCQTASAQNMTTPVTGLYANCPTPEALTVAVSELECIFPRSPGKRMALDKSLLPNV